MSQSYNPIRELAEQAKRGNQAARNQFQNFLQRYLPHIVRRTLEQGSGGTFLDPDIFREARRLRLEMPAESLEDQEQFIHIVSQRVSALVMADLQPVRDLGLQTAETVCNATGSAVALAG